MMKKLFAVLLALTMLLSAAAIAEAGETQEAAGAAATPEPTPEPTPDPEELARQAFIQELAHTWYLNDMVGDDMSIAPEIFALDRALEFKADGTVTALDARESAASEGTWTLEGEAVFVSIDDARLAFTLQDGNLVCEQEGLLIVFGLEKAEEEMFEPAAPVEAELEDFQGDWISYQLGMNDTFMSTSLLDMDVVASIEGTLVKLDGFVFGGEMIQTEFVDGALQFYSEDIENDLAASFTAQILADGTMTMTAIANDDRIVFAMEKAEPETEE